MEMEMEMERLTQYSGIILSLTTYPLNLQTVSGNPWRQDGCDQILFSLLQGMQSLGTQIPKTCQRHVALSSCLCANSHDTQL